jgi:hypothetical protein
MARVRLTAEGVAQVHAAAEDYAWDLAGEIVRDMETMVPVLTGDLLSTLRRERIPGGARIHAGSVDGSHSASGEPVDYHLHQEYGTEKMAAQPYIRPAVYRWRGV